MYLIMSSVERVRALRVIRAIDLRMYIMGMQRTQKPAKRATTVTRWNVSLYPSGVSLT